jgi:hypothetical protein
MNKFLFPFYRIVVSKKSRMALLKKKLRERILAYYGSVPANKINSEEQEAIEYLKENTLTVFPYNFIEKYRPEQVKVYHDDEKGLKYVIHDEKRLYFKRRWSEERIKTAWSDLLKEQDIDSPHRYLSDSFTPGTDDLLADIGAAEGNFSLSMIDKVKKIYIFECNKDWIEALRATFEPWSEKVEIIAKYASDYDNKSHMRLDTFFKDKPDPVFLKIDVDGAEQSVLKSCSGLFSTGKPIKMALCTYHKKDDEKIFRTLLEKEGFRVAHSKGYMIFYYDYEKQMEAPYFRRGLLRAER